MSTWFSRIVASTNELRTIDGETRTTITPSPIAAIQQKIQEVLHDWPSLCNRELIYDGTKASDLTVLQWNVLCDSLSGANPEMGGFLLSPRLSLAWDKRKWRIIEEILKYEPDVSCLCEIDHYDDWFLPMLAKVGYRGCFVKKAASPTLQFTDREDGCAIFYRADKLEMISSYSFSYHVVDDNGFLKICSQVAVICLFRLLNVSSKDTLKYVVVATTHLKANKTLEGEEIRAQQARQLLDEVSKFRDSASISLECSSSDIPVIITGDMNAMPHESTDGYAALCYSEFSKSKLNFNSTYPVIGSEAFTTWKIRPSKKVDEQFSESKHTIDYIFYSNENCDVVYYVAMPSESDIGPTRVPSFRYPSDHFSLIAGFNLK